MGTITAALQAFAAFFGWRKQREAALDTPEMHDNARAKTRAEIADDATAEVAKNVLPDIRKDLAE